MLLQQSLRFHIMQTTRMAAYCMLCSGDKEKRQEENHSRERDLGVERIFPGIKQNIGFHVICVACFQLKSQISWNLACRGKPYSVNIVNLINKQNEWGGWVMESFQKKDLKENLLSHRQELGSGLFTLAKRGKKIIKGEGLPITQM